MREHHVKPHSRAEITIDIDNFIETLSSKISPVLEEFEDLKDLDYKGISLVFPNERIVEAAKNAFKEYFSTIKNKNMFGHLLFKNNTISFSLVFANLFSLNGLETIDNRLNFLLSYNDLKDDFTYEFVDPFLHSSSGEEPLFLQPFNWHLYIPPAQIKIININKECIKEFCNFYQLEQKPSYTDRYLEGKEKSYSPYPRI